MQWWRCVGCTCGVGALNIYIYAAANLLLNHCYMWIGICIIPYIYIIPYILELNLLDDVKQYATGRTALRPATQRR